jgi:hypothetical protein
MIGETLLGFSSQALYCAKNNGRNQAYWAKFPPQGESSQTI